jgi:CDP-diacylglycerol--glycerol-3-phosphate 3-phosphatidyltransferase
MVESVASKTIDASQLWWSFRGMVWSSYLGLWLLWIAAALTLITGLDYFVKAMPFLRDEK